MQQVLLYHKGLHNLQDDIIIHGSNQEGHDRRLRNVLCVFRDKGLTVLAAYVTFSINKSCVKF